MKREPTIAPAAPLKKAGLFPGCQHWLQLPLLSSQTGFDPIRVVIFGPIAAEGYPSHIATLPKTPCRVRTAACSRPLGRGKNEQNNSSILLYD